MNGYAPISLPLQAKLPMKKYLLFLFIPLALFSCRPEPKSNGQNGAAAEQEASLPQNPDPKKEQPPGQASASKPDAEPVVGSRPAYVPPQSQDVLAITARNARVRPGADVCVAFQVKGFTESVLSRGRLVVDKGVMAKTGGGQFIKRARCGEALR